MNTAIIKIRELKIEDIEKISKINIECWKHNYKGIISDKFLNDLCFKNRIEKAKIYYNKPEVFGLVAEVDGVIIGFIDGHPESNTEFEINRLYIDPKHQGKGYGKKLFQSLLSHTLLDKYTAINLFTLTDNSQSRGFYEKIGGKIGKEHKKEWGGIKYPIIEYKRKK